jgi:Flp pilus assembly protein TadG
LRITSQRAQALVEFALVSMFVMLLLGSVVELGFLFSHKLELANAARAGARWGTTNSSAWSAAASPASNTIEGQVQNAGGTCQLANSDTRIYIDYLAVSGSTQTLCGHYSATVGAFVPQAGYTQVTCVVPGSLVRVKLTNSYGLVTGLFGGVGAPISISAVAAMVITA